MSISYNNYCCGCGACEGICPKSAISMERDAMGFVRPVIHNGKCIDCGLCEKVCAFNSTSDKTNGTPKVYAARHQDFAEVMKSRSGAVFVELSKSILREGGTVYGAAFDNEFQVHHIKIDKESKLDALRGSKYVQSSLKDCFALIAQDLRNGLPVLFSGTPCQTDAIKSYLNVKRIDTKKLLLVDIVCHGVPSPLLWKEYIRYTEKKNRSRITAICFRDKEKYGWSSHAERIHFANSKVKYSVCWANLFNKGLLTRPECSVCPYTNLNRPSDITLGDFWGWEKTDQIINKDDKGVSLILINTPKGESFFESIKKDYTVVESDTTRCLQPNLIRPTEANPLQEQFFEDYRKHGFGYIVRKYSESGFSSRVKRFIKRVI